MDACAQIPHATAIRLDTPTGEYWLLLPSLGQGRPKCAPVARRVIAELDLFFPDDSDEEAERRAKAICDGCPVKPGCLEEALASNVEGIWAGTTRKERRQLQRRRPSAMQTRPGVARCAA